MPEADHVVTSQREAIASFHQDLQSAVLAKVPLEIGRSASFGGQNATVDKLTQLHEQVDVRLASMRGLPSLQAEGNREFPSRYLSALHVFAQTGDSRLALDGLSVRVRAKRQLARVVRSTLVYLLVILFVVTALLVFYSLYIVPSFQSLRVDLALVPEIDAPDRFDLASVLPAAVVILQIAGNALLLLLLFGASGRIGSWLGGRPYVTYSIALRTMRMLTHHGMTSNDASTIACGLVGNTHATRACVDSAVRDGNEGAALPDQFDALAAHYQSLASNRLAYLNVVLPAFFIAFVGGLIGLGYSLAVFLPVIWLLKDLSLPIS